MVNDTAAAPEHAAEMAPPDQAPREPVPGIALCLSGGGYRAMLFHVGTLWRLNDAGLLPRLDWVSSVSGGSITAGVLGVTWPRLNFDETGVGRSFVAEVVQPIRELAGQTIDIPAVLRGIWPTQSVAREVAATYRRVLFANATLQNLPDHPVFMINATSLQTASLWRFSKRTMGDYRVGIVHQPQTPLATAVAASSAFPPFLSPLALTIDPGTCQSVTGADLHREPFISRAILADGGVYDNLGLETAIKRFQTIWVSDAGAKIEAQERPWRLWGPQLLRVMNVVDNQVRSLRKRHLIESSQAGVERVAYWGIRSEIAKYHPAAALPCPLERTMQLAHIPTRLARLSNDLQERLINWGYAICDAALRKYFNEDLPEPGGFVYPEAAP